MFGIGMGPSNDEKSQYNRLSNASDFSTGLGEKDLTASSDFMQALLSGDSEKQAQVLAPQIGDIKTRAQQTNLSNSQFGTRSGGMTAANIANNDKTNADITSMISQLTGHAADSLGQMGTAALGMGMRGNEAGFGQAQTMQAQKAAKWTDIMNSITSIAAGVMGVPGIGGAAQDSTALFGTSKPLNLGRVGAAPGGPSGNWADAPMFPGI